MSRMPQTKAVSTRRRVAALDRHVGARIRERRIVLGFNQQRLAELIGVSYQQAHKYEKGINRISAGQLYRIARALNVDVGYFFEGIEAGAIPNDALIAQRRLMLELARNFVAIPVQRHQDGILSLARALADPDARRQRARDGGD
jgi:transcriptional regulator with XRE-family HTH domain